MGKKEGVWTVEMQMHYPEIIEAVLSPDGKSIVYTVKEPLMTDKQSAFITHLYLVQLADNSPVQLTFGESNNHTPRWSPDNRFIAFISNRSGKNNIRVMRTAGGESWALTAYNASDVQYLAWSPDGQKLAFLMTEPPGKKKQKALDKKDDAEMWDRDYDFSHVFLVPFKFGSRKPGRAKQLTAGRYHVFGLAWMPQGNALAILHRPTPLADDWESASLATFPINPEGKVRAVKRKALNQIATVSVWGGHPYPSPDGLWIACPTAEKPIAWGGADRVVLYRVDNTQSTSLASTPDGQAWIIGWSANGQQVYVGELNGVDTHIWALPVNGEAAAPVLTTPTFKGALHTAGQDKIVFSEESFHQPNSLKLLDAASGKGSAVTTPALPSNWPAERLPEVELRQWKVRDGYEIEGIVLYPLTYKPGQRYPLIVEVHGGPMGVFNRRFLGWPGRYCDSLAAAEERVCRAKGKSPRFQWLRESVPLCQLRRLGTGGLWRYHGRC